MIESWLFVLAMIAVLMIPGPTNALLASSAHQQGIAKTSLLIPAEFFGYMYAISLWALFIHLSAPIWPYLIDILHVLSAGYVFWMSFGRAVLALETNKVTADLLYKGSALLLVVCMLPVVARFF